jgi:hypothetical protein
MIKSKFMLVNRRYFLCQQLSWLQLQSRLERHHYAKNNKIPHFRKVMCFEDPKERIISRHWTLDFEGY